ncbi:uncharacterized protein LOC130636844 [Hydractinia symbiolongicarpus]|uniref:uncharacterized protein LOC130636844 n=1 Tax=Hydractinia symbiolongicarpus TaxID=13093 RepID=UPI00254EC328|nr:uncharacterized protein LOC130636844 [Hydractinia symbiolongicarpus]
MTTRNVIIFVVLLSLTSCSNATVNLKIGLYNYIPDVAGNQLQSYANYIKTKWDALGTGTTIQLVVDSSVYDPYGDLNTYLGSGAGSFDIIETDMVRSSELIGKVVEIQAGAASDQINVTRFVQATVDAVKHNTAYLGFPTFACGNFIIQTVLSGQAGVSLDGTNYTRFIQSADQAQNTMVYDGPCISAKPSNKRARLLGGKIDSSSGWYLPFIYLDSVADILGPASVQAEINNVLAGNPNNETIQKLRKFFGYFKDNCNAIDQTDIEDDVVNGKDGYFYGFSERLSIIYKKANYQNIRVLGSIAPPFGQQNHLLMYTDALVLNKAKYDQQDDEYKAAVMRFSKFLSSEELRKELVMGKDLQPERIRYLLPPVKEFFETTQNTLYQQYYQIIRNGFPSPSLSEATRQGMQAILKPLCYSLFAISGFFELLDARHGLPAVERSMSEGHYRCRKPSGALLQWICDKLYICTKVLKLDTSSRSRRNCKHCTYVSRVNRDCSLLELINLDFRQSLYYR